MTNPRRLRRLDPILKGLLVLACGAMLVRWLLPSGSAPGPRGDKALEERDALYREAEALEDVDEALERLDRLAGLEPTSARGPLLRARRLSDPRHLPSLDVPAALAAAREAARIAPGDPAGAFEEGRILLLAARPAEAAAVLERIPGLPRAHALAAYCRLRLGDVGAATRLLGRPPGQGAKPQDAGRRDLLARLLDLGPDDGWAVTPLPLEGGEGRMSAFEDVDGDGHKDARVRGVAVLLHGLVPGKVVDAPIAMDGCIREAPAPYAFDDAARFALDPPAIVHADPPGTCQVVEADANGDGVLDRYVACGCEDPAAPLPWWLLIREGDGWRPVRGAVPEPGFHVSALAVADLDGDGRPEVLVVGGGWMRGDVGRTYLATRKGAP